MTRITHPPFDGERLALESRPCPIFPNAVVQLVTVAAMVALAWFVLCAADWSMPV